MNPIHRPQIPRLAAIAAVFIATAVAIPCHALVIYNKANNSTDITTNPNDGSPWETVARIAFNGDTEGSAVYLGNRYLMTADHIGPGSTRTVQFTPGGTNYSISADFAPQQVATGVDLKIFRITSDPGITGASLFDGTNEQGKNATVVGWGFGRDSSLANPGDTTQEWADQATSTKRWGNNVITNGSKNNSYNLNNKSYNYEAIEYTLGDNQGDTEAGASRWDSGGAMFIQDNNTWYLAGTMAIVQAQTEWSSTFNSFVTGETGDSNSGPRISTYKTDIEAIVPESSTSALALGVVALLAVTNLRRRRV